MARTSVRLLSALAVLVFVLTGCAAAADDTGGVQKIRIALDWTPNTNHTGLYVAQQEGWFRDAGLDVEFLPYASSAPDTLVSSGAAEFGISFQDTFTFSRAAGADITSVMSVLQHWASAIAVRADRADISSPRDLDGKTYGGFGGPGEEPKMRSVIQQAGGTGSFSTVVLGTAAYEALYAGQVDFTEPFVTWEAIEAELRGQPLRTFPYTDYGFPDAYGVVVIGNTGWLGQNPDLAARFVGAARRGYELAADDPARGAALLMEANPGTFSEPELVTRSQALMSAEYLRDPAGAVGTQTEQMWAGFSGFLYDAGALSGPDGAPLAVRPDFSTWFTNDHLGT